MTEVQERQQEAVRAGPAGLLRLAPPAVWYLLASAVLVSLCSWSIVVDGWPGEGVRVAAVFVCLSVLVLGAEPWVHKRTAARERVVLRMVESNESVVMISLAAVTWLGWGAVPPILAGVLGAAPSLIGLWGLHALRKTTA
ncbi:hypothetical protein [Actinomyces ruminicola]|uniref:Uncharacterized protein n=1 Tax=Actinomyces ruminicola TaxID=332524 RepID=A0A1G9V530_9ACTO|nr:hypothetical protein [Actinomyces ruminicola]SDM67249.1 hypothetical protein SAMN04487766_105103 [Actinomyces ruminicola]